jgi:hypothetical protein
MQDEQDDEPRTDDEGATKPNPPKIGPEFEQREQTAALPYLD